MQSENKKVILVTGSTGGIGKACVEQLLNNEHAVAGFDRETAGRDLLNSEGYEHFVGDISRTEDCQAVVQMALDRFGRLDGLIHWAGIHSRFTWVELTAEEMNQVLAVNVTGSFLIAQAAANAIKKHKEGGAIVLTGSTSVIHGTTGGGPGYGGPAYVASKAAMTGLVRSLARGMGTHNIRVNGVMPGVTQTPMIANYSQENLEFQASQSAIGRIGQPDDVAGVGCFLVGDAARYISGEMIIINGGAAFG